MSIFSGAWKSQGSHSAVQCQEEGRAYIFGGDKIEGGLEFRNFCHRGGWWEKT